MPPARTTLLTLITVLEGTIMSVPNIEIVFVAVCITPHVRSGPCCYARVKAITEDVRYQPSGPARISTFLESTCPGLYAEIRIIDRFKAVKARDCHTVYRERGPIHDLYISPLTEIYPSSALTPSTMPETVSQDGSVRRNILYLSTSQVV
jgi:hypothetical protein